MSQLVFSYRRFSSGGKEGKQAKGTSIERQLTAAREYCKRNGLVLNETMSFEDISVSAFHGRNSDTGRLGDFKRAVEDGTIPNNSILIIESLDRASRQTARKALRVLEDICELGITVVTLSDGKSYTKEALDDDPMSLLIALLIFIRANEESKIKSLRVRAAWKSRKNKAIETGYRLREVYPRWIDRNGQPIKERVEVVQRIFRAYLSGMTMKECAIALNADGIECFKGGKAWWDDAIRRILCNKATIGYYKERTGYFPSIISVQDFEDVTALRTSKAKPRRYVGTFANPLSGIAKCPECGCAMTRISKGTGNKSGKPKLVCLDWKRGRVQHNYHAFDLDKAVEKLLSYLPIIMDEQPSSDANLDEEIFAINRQIVSVQQQIERLVELVTEGTNSEAVGSKITALESRQKVLAAERAELEEMASAGSPINVKRRRDDLLRNLTTDDPALLNAKLRQVLKGVVFTKDGGIEKWEFH